ncbi:MAG TPA: Holliday junction resolvase RuvX [Casimicrobiaceae bacterium]|nr:Holliday junction resolvase RuvX [Casimicrobiaceae bacterium]
MTLPADATILAFDFGTRRIGVAVGNTMLRIARPLLTLELKSNSADAIDAIAPLVEEWSPALLVVGLPVHADGTAHDMTAKARRFAQRLEIAFARPVRLVDERYTTAAAASELDAREAGRAGRFVRDQLAAQLILQAYFDSPDDSNPAP